MLLRPLESGVDEPGDEAPFLVTEDVKDSAGRVIIRKGTPAQGIVALSRPASLAAGMLNRPPRLSLRALVTVTVDGRAVDLCGNLKNPAAPLELTRTNTSPYLAFQSVRNTELTARSSVVLNTNQAACDVVPPATIPGAHSDLATSIPEFAVMSQRRDESKARQILDRLLTIPYSKLGSAAADGPITALTLVELTPDFNSLRGKFDRVVSGKNIRALIGTPLITYLAR